MHYMGMFAMNMRASMDFDLNIVGLSVAIAITAAGAALWLAFNLRRLGEDRPPQAGIGVIAEVRALIDKAADIAFRSGESDCLCERCQRVAFTRGSGKAQLVVVPAARLHDRAGARIEVFPQSR